MGEKEKLIQKMIAMQKKFIAKQRASGVTSREYFMPEEDEELSGYNEEYEKMAARVIDLAHEETGSSR